MMAVKRLSALALIIMLATAGASFAQNGKKKAPGTDIAVAKDLTNFEDAQYTSIQAAINAAKAGDVIEILDTEVYEGQITIDGRDESPWPGVTGKKTGITIRYVPPAGTKPNSAFVRPTIRYRDITNRSPKTMAEAQVEGELPGMVANFETCGVVRLLRTNGVTLDGLAIDGVSAEPFGANGVWAGTGCDGGPCPIFHGNAGITLVVSGGVTIRNCDIKNSYFGVNVKDRNTGGVFANKNESDIDVTVALSGFGQTGAHLFEYNRVHNNSVAFFFESTWDLGSSIRYNFIYSNKHTADAKNKITIQPNNQNDGGFLFKDMYLAPLAIYNNTLYDNTANLLGNWQMGGQHLIFNNIFSKSSPDLAPSSYMVIDAMFPNRMHSCVFSAKTVGVDCRTDLNCPGNNAIAPGGCLVNNVQFQGFTNPSQTSIRLEDCRNPGQTNQQSAVMPGARIPGASQTVLFPANANVGWLQTEGYSTTLQPLFKSVNPTSADFLFPDWDNAQVKEYIKNKGWVNIGIRNSDGSIADLGAVPSTGQTPFTDARIKPTFVVMVTGGTRADASVSLTVESGTLNNPKIKFLRWVSPIPDNSNKWANDWTVIPESSIRTITNTSAVPVGWAEFTFTLPSAVTGNNKYGFFEIVVEGTDANGNLVSSDVGFLPYRQLEYELVIEVFPATGDMTPATRLTSVVAGTPVRVRVTPRKIGESGTFPTALREIAFQLLSNPATSFMKNPTTKQPITKINPTTGQTVVVFPAYFEKAGDEIIRGAGETGGSTPLGFLGNGEIKVLPGPPKKLEFKDPMSLTQLGTAPAPVINRGVPRDVKVQVQDEFGNATGKGITVNISVDNPAIGDIDVKSVVTNDSGMAIFVAKVTNGQQGENFIMTATGPSGVTDDKGKLRVGRVMDRLEVFYSDNGPGKDWGTYFDDEVWLNGTFPGTGCYQITVKAVSPDTVITSKNGGTVRLLEGADNIYDNGDLLEFSALCDTWTPTTVFNMSNGVATFYVRARSNVERDAFESGLGVSLYLANGDRDYSVTDGGRANIRFTKAKSDVHYAVVYGNGYGQPNEVRIHYTPGPATFGNGLLPPDSVSLAWPTAGAAPVVNTGAITTDGPLTAIVKFDASKFVKGYTGISGDGVGMVQILGSNSPGGNFEVLDGIGPILADDGDSISGRGSPIVEENLDVGNKPDVLTIQVSEGIGDDAVVFSELKKSGAIRYSSGLLDRPAADSLGEALIVSEVAATTDGYRLVLDLTSPHPQRGDWVRFNPSASIYDIAGSGPVIGGYTHENVKVQEDNRWVQVKEITEAPPIEVAWYTNTAKWGVRDSIFVTFKKPVDMAWFGRGAYIKFDGGANYTVPEAGSPIRLVDEYTVGINLSVAWPQSVIITSSPVSLEIGFNKDGTREGWTSVTGSAVDRAKPVLVQRVIIRKGAKGETPEPDMIDVVYSEELADTGAASIRNIKQPIVIYTKIDPLVGIVPTLTYENWAPVPVAGTMYYKVTYSVDGGELSDDIKAGDSVKINASAGVTDKYGSPRQTLGGAQDEDNHRVPIGMDYTQLWELKALNNPFKPTGSGGPSDVAVFELRSGVDEFEVEAKMRLYDNVGNLVAKKDTTSGGGKVAWTWDGYNGNGRMVGTGTYRLKVVAKARDPGDPTATPIEHKNATSIRFVRGKK